MVILILGLFQQGSFMKAEILVLFIDIFQKLRTVPTTYKILGICRTLNPIAAEFSLFSNTLGPFFKRDHMLGNKIKKIEIIPIIFCQPQWSETKSQ